MRFDRREFLAASVAAATLACAEKAEQAASSTASRSTSKLGIPGPYPGRVVEVHHPGSHIDGAYQAEPVEQMLDRGMMELTHAEAPVEAWREFFEPGDVVGIKLNAVGKPAVISDPSVFRAIVSRLEAVGIPRKDIIAYDRNGQAFQDAGFVDWLPEGVRWTSAWDPMPKMQTDIRGHDPDVFMEMPLIFPGYVGDYRADDPVLRRSHVCTFLTKEVNKLINVPLLKHHQSAGVTLALKNLSHGFSNNVNRSHASTTANACGIFIPAAVDQPIFREKVVLNILDGVYAAYHGGPGTTVQHYAWPHRTMYFATDPVALDKVGWRAIDAKRAEVGRQPIALMKPDEHSRWLNGQVEHIELAANFGLGVFDDEQLRVKRVDLG